MDALCRHGDPYRGGDNAIVVFEAAVGSERGKDDISPFREVKHFIIFGLRSGKWSGA